MLTLSESREGLFARIRQAFAAVAVNARSRRFSLQLAGTVVVSILLLAVLIFTGVTEPIDNALYDQGLRLRREAPRSDIVIVAVDDKSLNSMGRWPWSRPVETALMDTIIKGRPKALALYFMFVFRSTDAQDKAFGDALAKTDSFLEITTSVSKTGQDQSRIKVLPLIAQSVRGMGRGDAEPDKDGIVRRTRLFDGARGQSRASLALQLARLDGHLADPANSLLGLSEMLIPFVGGPGSFPYYSATKVANGQVDPSVFKDKYVLFGAIDPGLVDNHPTAMSATNQMPNVEIDANILNSLLNGRAIVPVSKWLSMVIWLVPLGFALLTLVRVGSRGYLFLAVATIPVPILLAIGCVARADLWLPPMPFVATAAVILPFWSWRRLAAASAYISEELTSLERSVGDAVAPRSRSLSGGDQVLQQIMLLEDTKRRISDLQRFVADILANFPDPILVVDRAGRILTRNQAASDLTNRFGVSGEVNAPIEPLLRTIQAYGRDPRPLWPPPDLTDTNGALSSARPMTGLGPTGRAYELRFTPTLNVTGDSTGWVLHLADITPLVSAMRQREDALEVVSHDMRTFLTAIMAILANPDSDADPVRMKERIAFQTERTIELADAFVRLAKAEAAESILEPIDLVHALVDARDMAWELAEAAQVKIAFEPDETEHVILADRGHLTRALVNLIDNAVKFSPKGATVTCTLGPSVLNGTPAVECAIADVGAGMAQTRVARLMAQFDSARGAVSSVDGVGLGLALVHAVVTRHNGVISCESAEGKGTIFTVTLPIHDEPEEALDAAETH